MDLQLGGAAVLVTGGSRGLGRAFALAFAAEGADVGICARDGSELEAVAAAVRDLGVRCLAVPADLTRAEDCRRAVDRTAEAFGRLDVLVNNASPVVDSTPASLEAATDEQVMARLTGKTLGAIRCSRAALPHMRRAGGGRIVCIGGTSARSVFRAGDLPMSGSTLPQGLGNAALTNFARHLAEEVAGDGIVVNTVQPHLIRTSRHPARVAELARRSGRSEAAVEAELNAQSPIGRVLEAADVTPLVLLLASPLAGGITGQAVAVDGGALRAVAY